MIKRKLEQYIEKRMFSGKAILLFGPRQTGKTTLLEHLLSKRSEKALVLSGDEPDVREFLPHATSTYLKNLIGKNQIIFIDGAQRIPDIGLVIKLITDKIKHAQVVATGSSALELAGHTKEHLTGRKYEYFLYPFSFAELAGHYGLLEEKRNLEHRLIYGCYPEIVCSNGDEKELLKLLTSSYLYKDLLMLDQIKKPLLLENLLKALALQVGSEVSFNELSQLVGANKDTVTKYIDLLEKVFVIFRLPALRRNARNELKKSRKIYFYDNGIRNAVIGDFKPIALRNDAGALWENFVISERMKYIAYENIEAGCYFWRTTQQQEIDYVEESDGIFHAFEFKWKNTGKAKISKTFTRNYPNNTFDIITPENYQTFLEP